MSSRSSGPRALVLVVIFLAGCGARPRPAPAPAPASAAPSGLRVFRDPVTGAFVEPPAAPPALGPQRAAPAAPSALTETAAPGGGTMIRLNGALRSDVTAKVGARGADVSCATVPARR